MKLEQVSGYRRDIDGLRAIAVVAVIIFHFGVLPNGYLGVDVFFVISGYLITGIIARELGEGRFSIVNFYLRRARRILPLSLFLVLLSLAVGLVVMLPDDLENLAQSIVATNAFSNNILQAITTKNYWDVVNEFKPLMHTWSLGIEEQYYVFYPMLLLLIGRRHKSFLLPTLAALAALSLLLNFTPYPEYVKFYHLPFRFFELASGGIAVLLLRDRVFVHRAAPAFVFGLIAIQCLHPAWLPASATRIAAVLLSLGIIVTANGESRIAAAMLQNRVAVGVGLISFSLYMWHQILLAYARYFVVQRLEYWHLPILFLVVVLLSIVSYYVIEQPFRDRKRLSTRTLLLTVGALFLATTLPALAVYRMGGVIRDVPELCVYRASSGRNIHSAYNTRVHAYEKPFGEEPGRVKVLVVGNSFARDWANVLLESGFRERIDLSYASLPSARPDLASRLREADVIFFSTASREDVEKLGIDESKLYVVGTKNFGVNAGYFYNHRGPDYFAQRTAMEAGTLELNNRLKRDWGGRCIDLIAKVIAPDQTVPVFTPEHKFISQDCRHFTESGAVYFARLMEPDLPAMLGSGVPTVGGGTD